MFTLSNTEAIRSFLYIGGDIDTKDVIMKYVIAIIKMLIFIDHLFTSMLSAFLYYLI